MVFAWLILQTAHLLSFCRKMALFKNYISLLFLCEAKLKTIKNKRLMRKC